MYAGVGILDRLHGNACLLLISKSNPPRVAFVGHSLVHDSCDYCVLLKKSL